MLVQQFEEKTKRLEENIILLNDDNEKRQDVSQKFKELELIKANESIDDLKIHLEIKH